MTAQPHPLASDNHSLRNDWLRKAFPVEQLHADLRATHGASARFNLRDWFPSGDDTAAKVATAAILREDLDAVRFDAVDSDRRMLLAEEDPRPHQRREQHNLRLLMRALGDTKNLLNILANNSPGWWSEAGKDAKENLLTVTTFFSMEYQAHLQSHRDNVGGHLGWNALRDGLPGAAQVDILELTLGDHPDDLNHWYATQLSIVAVLRTVPNESWEATFKNAVQRALVLVSLAIRVLDWLVLGYVLRRRYMPAPLPTPTQAPTAG